MPDEFDLTFNNDGLDIRNSLGLGENEPVRHRHRSIMVAAIRRGAVAKFKGQQDSGTKYRSSSQDLSANQEYAYD